MRRRFAFLLPVFALTSLALSADPTLAPGPTPVAAPTPEPRFDRKLESFRVREGLSTIWVDVHTPYPTEIDNETQSRALAKEAATALGDNAILRYVLTKRTSKGKPLSEAQVPSTEIQDGVKALISGAQVSAVRFDKDGCRLRVSIDKRNLKVILRKG